MTLEFSNSVGLASDTPSVPPKSAPPVVSTLSLDESGTSLSSQSSPPPFVAPPVSSSLALSDVAEIPVLPDDVPQLPAFTAPPAQRPTPELSLPLSTPPSPAVIAAAPPPHAFARLGWSEEAAPTASVVPTVPPAASDDDRPPIFAALQQLSGGTAPPPSAAPAWTPGTPVSPAADEPPPIFRALAALHTGPLAEEPPAAVPSAPVRVAPPAAVEPTPAASSLPPPPSGGKLDGGGGAPSGGPPPVAGMARIGDKLVELGLISKDQLQVALYEKKRSNKLLGNLLVDLGFITESALSAVLASSSGFERFDPKATVVEPEMVSRFPKEMAQRYRVLPVSLDGNSLRLAMADIYDVLALDQARRYLPPGCEIIPLVCSETEIAAAIDQYYGYEFSIDGILRELETGHHDTSVSALSGDGYVHPLVRLVNAILLDAVKTGASDIHFEPEGSFLRLRYRIDGVMNQVRTFHKDHWPAISHRLKIVSGMNIADKLNPQDGRFGFLMGQRKVDFRVAALPTVHGENIVIRILDKSGALLSIESLGLSPNNIALLNKMLKRPEGIIIVTGPTGSGKTTTLYGILNHINSLERNIMTLEDPVEYELPLIRQAQVREGTGLNFSDGVRALLRQDPDIIFIGEIRDQATASMALRASMTGHQVFSTLHTNDAAGAIPRLHDLGLDHGLLSGNIIGILAQRLARKLCTCSTPRVATAEECRIFGVDPADPPDVGATVGCELCRFTGYRGRVAVHEILPVNKELDELILSGASLNKVRIEAQKFGYVPIADDGISKILMGIISLESLMRSVDVTERL